MGKVWVLRPDGYRLHLPVVGDVDINTPDTAIPLGTVGLRGRAYSGTVQVAHPTLGTFEIDFDPPGRTGGPCIQCGLCCTHPVDQCPMPPQGCGYLLDTEYNIHKCKHLVIAPGAKKLGKSGGTECGARSTIFEISKGCTLSPDRREPWYPDCPFVFEGE